MSDKDTLELRMDNMKKVLEDPIMSKVYVAADALVKKMQEAYDDPRYSSVWTISQIHVGPYTGPCWKDEFNELVEAIKLDS